MKKKYYVVTFYNGRTVFACAFNSSEAIILSQAIMIKNGFTYDVESMRETRYESDKQLTDFLCMNVCFHLMRRIRNE